MKILSIVGLVVFALLAPATGLVAADLQSDLYVAPVKAIVDVPVTSEIRDWFNRHQVDGSLIGTPNLSESVKLDIDRVLANGDPVGGNGLNAGSSTSHVNQAALEALIAPALQAAVQPGTEVRMVIGDRVWFLKG